MADSQVVCGILDEMTSSMASVRESMQSLKQKLKTADDMDMKDGISLLSLKHHLLLSYLQSLVLLSARRATGDSLTERTSASSPFSTVDREARGSGAGDLVDSMIEGRVVLEKIKVLESRMRYQIEKLVRVAEEVPSGKDVVEDPLAFRPNPQNLVDNEQHSNEDQDGRSDVEDIYRPPKLAPMPYTEAAADKRSKRQPVPKALSTLLHQDPSRPHVEGTSGLGSMPSLASDRAREIQRIKDFEEENFTRLVMKKKDARRRRKDEEDLALGGTGAGKGRKRGRGLEDEFADVLHSVGRTKTGVLGDGYEELRQRGKKADALSRSRTTQWKGDLEGADDVGPRLQKKTRFEKAKTTLHKKMKARKR
ncbi:hypothetical protein DFJ58DRAFT_704798 [Suillus subalutaceus]|uniref:uncharacterized protein n=1 Tax=Suillus subalutaceus TaxID=48586 RepID=UPI001B872FAF|nr:uncharacterized protein DFJ58DRAFT_704798 [Suillus subalutaceus]KAG1849146.1 hypothetical protein DFJ58DRAFT_704798 [Suillus subalutaceus]